MGACNIIIIRHRKHGLAYAVSFYGKRDNISNNIQRSITQYILPILANNNQTKKGNVIYAFR